MNCLCHVPIEWKLEGVAYPHERECPLSESYRGAAIADWRRKCRKTMLLKALREVGLTILICGGTLSVLYALIR